jgi:hypothetical protein
MVEVSNYDIRDVGRESPGRLVISNRKAPIFEAPAPAPDCFNIDSSFSENSSKFSMYCFSSPALREQGFDYTSLLVPIQKSSQTLVSTFEVKRC